MSNLIKNIVKTLLFFDLIIIIEYYFIGFENSSPVINTLLYEVVFLGVVLAFTFLFILFAEKKKILIPFKNEPKKSAIIGGVGGLFISALGMAVLVAFGQIDLLGFNKPEAVYLYIPMLLLNAVSSELLLRGYLYSLYKTHYGFLGAMAITTALFASLKTDLFSNNPLLLVNLILLNLLICFIYEFTGSFVTVVTARFFYTLVSVFVFGSLKLQNQYPVWVVTEGSTLEGSWIFTVILSILLILCLCQKYKLHITVKRYLPIIIKRIKEFNVQELIINIRFKFAMLKKKLRKMK